LWKHLKKHHPEEYTLSSRNSRHPSESTSTIPSYSDSVLRQLLIKWIIKKDQPFTVVENEEFCEIVSYLRPNASLPSPTTVKRDILRLYEIQKQMVINLLQRSSGRISFAMDAWTSANFIPFLGITVHWIDENWKLQCMLLSLEPLSGSHSGENLSKVFVNTCNEFGILTKIQAITTDSASNNFTFAQHLENACQIRGIQFQAKNFHVRCLAHVMNLAVQDFLEELKSQPLNDEDDYLGLEIEGRNVGTITKLRYVSGIQYQ
jgi:hypothetical protein